MIYLKPDEKNLREAERVSEKNINIDKEKRNMNEHERVREKWEKKTAKKFYEWKSERKRTKKFIYSFNSPLKNGI